MAEFWHRKSNPRKIYRRLTVPPMMDTPYVLWMLQVLSMTGR